MVPMFPMKFITSYVCDFLKVFLSFILRGLVGLSCIRLSNDLIRIEVRICAQNGVEFLLSSEISTLV